MRPRRWRVGVCLATGVALTLCVACAKGEPELGAWHAMQPEIEMRLGPGEGPAGETTLDLQYTIAPGKDYAIARDRAGSGLSGGPVVHLQAKATRVLHLAVVLVDLTGQEHACGRTLVPGAWQELQFSDWIPAVDEWESVQALRLVDRTGGLGGQGPVSLKLVGLPLQ